MERIVETLPLGLRFHSTHEDEGFRTSSPWLMSANGNFQVNRIIQVFSFVEI